MTHSTAGTHLRRMRTRRAVTAAVVVAGVGLVPPMLTGARAAPCQYAASLGSGWSILTDPPFTVGPTAGSRTVRYPFTRGGGALFAALPGDGATLLATNGSQIMRSSNRGCTWTPVYTFQGGDLGQSPPALEGSPVQVYTDEFTGTYEIQAFGIPRYPSRRHALYAVVAVDGGSVAPSLVTDFTATPPVILLRSSDDGQSWQQVGQSPSLTAPAIPRCYEPDIPWDGPLELAVAPNDPDTLYLACGTNGKLDQAIKTATSGQSDISLYESTDGGASWVQRTSPTSDAAGMPLQGLAVDPRHPEQVWLATTWSNVGGTTTTVATPSVWYSADSGQHWVRRATGGWGLINGDPRNHESVADYGEFGVDVAPTGSVTVARGTDGVLASTDAGHHWHNYATAGKPAGTVIAHSVFAPNGDLFAVRDLGVPPKYAGPVFCANDATSWEQLIRIHAGRAQSVATPWGVVADWYDLQTAGTAVSTTIYGYGLVRLAPKNCTAYQPAFLSWVGRT